MSTKAIDDTKESLLNRSSANDDNKTTDAGDEPDSKPKEISYESIPLCDALKKTSKLASLLFVGGIFYPIFQIVNSVVVGHSGDDETPLAGLALGVTTVSLLANTPSRYFANGIATMMS